MSRPRSNIHAVFEQMCQPLDDCQTKAEPSGASVVAIADLDELLEHIVQPIRRDA
ncbi:hypothetical protein J2849_002687 [Azospirillum melinis]|nr:hypothetical protein [Azospirillum melinis]